MDVSQLRAEIKSWEHQFRHQHGRDPSIQEIKRLPDIADKYKLYKKLSKQPQPSQADRRSASPRDAPRPSTSALLSTSKSKSRPVKTDPSASTSNPFSPVKSKHGKQREPSPDADSLPIASLLSSVTRTNPFKTPTKPKTREARRAPVPSIHELDEDPFPLIAKPSQVKSTQSSSTSHTEQPPTTSLFTDATEHPPLAIAAAKDKSAVSRARKRLRGEPVSPSPVKEKRPRVVGKMAAQAALTFNEADSSDEDGPVQRGGDTFIDDTPAKPPIGKKQFKVLFDEAMLPASQPLPANTRFNDASLARSKSVNGKGLFGFGFSAKDSSSKESSRSKSRVRSPSPLHSDEDMYWNASSNGPSTKLGAPEFSPSVPKRPLATKAIKNGMRIPKAMIPGKDDLWTNSAPQNATKSSAKKRSPSPAPPSAHPQPRPTPKATLSTLPLLPPSPPTETQSKPRYGDKGKGKALMRKKTKLMGVDEDEDSDEGSEEVKVREAPWRWGRHNSHGQEELVPGLSQQADSEPEFDVGVYRPSVPQGPSWPPADGEDEEQFEVDLPEDLRRVLALSPPPHVAPDSEEEAKLVRGLLYGRREGHYDPSRGGEIWGVGEVSEEEDVLGLGQERTRGREEDEDEWEGEPVPWEVGEL